MKLTIDLPPETERKLGEIAASRGLDVPDFVHELPDQAIHAANGNQAGPQNTSTSGTSATLDQILAPVREKFERSGMSEDELTDFLTGVRDEVRREKRMRTVS